MIMSLAWTATRSGDHARVFSLCEEVLPMFPGDWRCPTLRGRPRRTRTFGARAWRRETSAFCHRGRRLADHAPNRGPVEPQLGTLRPKLGDAAPRPPRPSREGRFFFQAEDGIRDYKVTGVQTCALPI